MACSRAVFAQADETRYVQINGITYCETYRTVQRTINETAYQQTTQTVYKEQFDSEVRDVTRTYLCPVTTYRAETEMVGKWNFFIDTGFDFQTVVQRITPYLLLITLFSLGFLFVYYPRLPANPASSSASLLDKIQHELVQHKSLPFVLAVLALLFIAAHFLSWRFQMDEHLKWSLLFFAQEFNLDNENVLSAYFSGFILFSAGCLLAVIAADPPTVSPACGTTRST